jgi:hypothetical protein
VSSPASAQYGTFVPKAGPKPPPLAHTAQPPRSTVKQPTGGLPFTGISLPLVLLLAVIILVSGTWLRMRARR